MHIIILKTCFISPSMYLNIFFLLGLLSATDERLQVGLEELQDLKGVWSELAKIWDQIDQMKEQPWLSVQPRKVRFSQIV